MGKIRVLHVVECAGGVDRYLRNKEKSRFET